MKVTTPKCTSTWLVTNQGTESNCKAVQDRPLEERNRPLPRQDVVRPAAMLNYLVVRVAREGPLFIFRDGHFVMRQRLVYGMLERS